MFGTKNNRYGSLIAIVGGAVASGVAILSIPAIRKRALRATTILKKDHRVVSGLFWTLQQATVPSIRQAIFNKIQTELDVHATVEEEIFYPAVRNLYSGNAEALVEEAKREHDQMRTLIGEVAALDPSSFRFMSKANELKDTVEHHVEEEENEIFPLVQSMMSNDELYNLGRRMHDRKYQIQERVAA